MASNYYEYETVDGDTFDIIALSFYGNENYSTKILQANPTYVQHIILPAGITLKIPIIETTAASTLPPWKRSEVSV